MNPLKENVDIRVLETIFRKTRKHSPAPYLKDPAARRQAATFAKTQGVWKALDEFLEIPEVIPPIPRSSYRDFNRTGNRSRCEAIIFRRAYLLGLHGLGLWLGHPKASLDFFQDMIWSICEETNWALPAHEAQIAPDLRAMELGAQMAEWKWLLDDMLEEEVAGRISAEIDRRIFRQVYSPDTRAWWRGCENNWNHVCVGSLIRTVLYERNDSWDLANMLYDPIREMNAGLEGFMADGGCTESIGYWGYGFGHYLRAAYALYCKTNGRLNIMDDPKVEACCRYPLAAYIDPPYAGQFGDASHGKTSLLAAMIINRFFDIPELYACCNPLTAAGLKQNLRSISPYPLVHVLAMHPPKKCPPYHKTDASLEIGLFKFNSAPGEHQTTLMGTAGYNAFNHNHNDVGSFILYRDGVCWLTDPGSPVYNRATFSDKRYENPFINSFFHSVPVINGTLQETSPRKNPLKLTNLGGEFPKQAAMDITRAYPRDTAKKIARTFTLAEDGAVTLRDEFTFEKKPRSLEDAFITFEKATVAKNKQSVVIKNGRERLTLRAANTPGAFRVDVMTEESQQGRDGRVVNRIVFTPKTLDKKMTLTFEMK